MQGSLDLYRRIDSAADKSVILGFLRIRSDVLFYMEGAADLEGHV